MLNSRPYLKRFRQTDMVVRFWGVRGSLPTPSAANLKYGGNTSCVEVRTKSGQLIILDAGTGIRALGQKLKDEAPPNGHRIMLFLSHYHWDHIQGIPFFEPLYDPANFVYLHGFKTSEASVERALGEQMSNPFFPVDASVRRATRHFYAISEETLQIGDAVVTTRFLNHPQGCLGYRIEADGHAIVYASDNEHGSQVHDHNVRQLASDADLFIYDTQYTSEEYNSRRGWGHSTWEVGADIAVETGAKCLVLFHHDPDRSDFLLDEMLVAAKQRFPCSLAAFEGMELDVATAPEASTSFDKRYIARQDVFSPVVVRVLGTQVRQYDGALENISFGGAYLVSSAPLPPGQLVEIELQGKDNEKFIKAKARVVRCVKIGSRFGIGISFR